MATVLRPLVGIWFQVLLTRLTAVLFTFHSRYFCAIGRQGVLSLGRWSSRIHAGFHVSGATRDTRRRAFLSRTGLSPSVAGLSMPFCWVCLCNSVRRVPQPRLRRMTQPVWADPFSLAATGGVEVFLSFPASTEMFQFPAFASPAYIFSRGYRAFSPGGLPHSEIHGSTLFGSSPWLIAAFTSFIAS